MINPDDDGSIELNGDDSSCLARFYWHPKFMAAKSREEGRPIHEDRCYVEIMVKGQPQAIFSREATEEDKRRFPRAYQAFKTGAELPAVGTPLVQAGFTPSVVTMLAPLGVKTVEDLAQLSDAGLQNLGHGGREMQNRAKAYLEKNDTRSAELKAALEATQSQLKEALSRIAELEGNAQTRRGRPRKERAMVG